MLGPYPGAISEGSVLRAAFALRAIAFRQRLYSNLATDLAGGA